MSVQPVIGEEICGACEGKGGFPADGSWCTDCLGAGVLPLAPSSVRSRVVKGVRFLDENDPGWWVAGVPGAIDLATLDMTSARRCILGQRCPVEVLACGTEDLRYFAYARHLSHILDGLEEWADEHGFLLLGVAACDPLWDELAAEWRGVIAARRAA